jgi:ribosome biogenesis GTPase A
MRELEDEIAKANMFIEVRDSRIPITSHNPELLSLIPSGMKRLIVYNKIDIANEKKTLELIRREHETNKIPYMHISTKDNVNVNKLS